MQKHAHNILEPAQADYLDSLLPPRDPLRAQMESVAAEEGIPIAAPALGHLLEILAKGAGRTSILEIGTAIGYGTLCLARGATEARVTTIDRDRGIQDRARTFLEEGKVLDRVELVTGEALEVIPRLTGPFDLIYLDGDKASYRRCLDLALQKLRVGGLMVVDNLLWKGEIADPPLDGLGESARAIETFNTNFMIHPQLRALVLPLGDALASPPSTSRSSPTSVGRTSRPLARTLNRLEFDSPEETPLMNPALSVPRTLIVLAALAALLH